jgi:hypothetical protein
MNATGQAFADQTVYLDGCAYYNCRFTDCNLVYSGLMPVTLVGCTFLNCKFDFSGPAANTLQFLHLLAGAGGDARKVVQATLDAILRTD